jgi:hypothetical protein
MKREHFVEVVEESLDSLPRGCFGYFGRATGGVRDLKLRMGHFPHFLGAKVRALFWNVRTEGA